MTRKPVVFHLRQRVDEMSVLVAGNVLEIVAKEVWPWAAAMGQPPRSKIEKIAWCASGRFWGSGAFKVVGGLGQVEVCKVCHQAAQRKIEAHPSCGTAQVR